MATLTFLSSVLAIGAAAPSWEEYKAEFGLSFTGDEDTEHQANYNVQVQMIEASNRDTKRYVLGVNKFTYLSTEEFLRTYTGESAEHAELHDVDVARFESSGDASDLPSAVDWSKDSSVVPPVEDQGSCGSCWAFAAAGETEITYALEFGTMYNLAKQQLVDCDGEAWDFPGEGGCQGGLSSIAWQVGGYYATKGACLTTDYPYTALDGACLDSSCVPVIPPGALVGFASVPRGVLDLKAILVERPVKVSVHADSTWSAFESGVAEAPQCYTGTNHAVIAVGYDGDSSIKIRNSWGTGWGLSGYINIAQSSACSTGSYSIFYRTPYYPKFGGAVNV